MFNSIKDTSSKNKNQENISIGSAPAVRPGGADRGANLISCPPQVVNFSIDTLEISYKIHYKDDSPLFDLLQSAKDYLQTTMDQDQAFYFGKYSPRFDYGQNLGLHKQEKDNTYEFNIQRSGRKFYPFVLRAGDVFICLSSRPCDSTIPNLSLKIGSLSCQADLPGVLRSFKNFVRDCLGEIREEVVSRVDICADINTSIRKADVSDQEKQISRAIKTNQWYSRKKLQAVSIGAGDIICRIYDKLKEMDDKQDAVKAQFFMDKWASSGHIIEDVTRVEFQLRREFLKSIEITDFKSLYIRVAHLWSYLTRNWLRFSESAVDRDGKNQARAITSEFWEVVTSACRFAPALSRIKVKNLCDVEALGKQIRGCLTSILASVGHTKDDYFGMIATSRDFLSHIMSEYLCTDEFYRRFESRRLRATPVL